MPCLRLTRAVLPKPQQPPHRERNKLSQADQRRAGDEMVAIGERCRERVHPVRPRVRVHTGAHLHGLQVVSARRHAIREVKRLRHELATDRFLRLELRRVVSGHPKAKRVLEHADLREPILAAGRHC